MGQNSNFRHIFTVCFLGWIMFNSTIPSNQSNLIYFNFLCFYKLFGVKWLHSYTWGAWSVWSIASQHCHMKWSIAVRKAKLLGKSIERNTTVTIKWTLWNNFMRSKIEIVLCNICSYYLSCHFSFMTVFSLLFPLRCCDLLTLIMIIGFYLALCCVYFSGASNKSNNKKTRPITIIMLGAKLYSCILLQCKVNEVRSGQWNTIPSIWKCYRKPNK